MKELSNFLREQDNGDEHDKARPLKEGEGADDKEYFDLMSQYKSLRRRDREAAGSILDQAMQLSENGDVSEKVKLAAAYL